MKKWQLKCTAAVQPVCGRNHCSSKKVINIGISMTFKPILSWRKNSKEVHTHNKIIKMMAIMFVNICLHTSKWFPPKNGVRVGATEDWYILHWPTILRYSPNAVAALRRELRGDSRGFWEVSFSTLFRFSQCYWCYKLLFWSQLYHANMGLSSKLCHEVNLSPFGWLTSECIVSIRSLLPHLWPGSLWVFSLGVVELLIKKFSVPALPVIRSTSAYIRKDSWPTHSKDIFWRRHLAHHLSLPIYWGKPSAHGWESVRV